MSADVQLVNDEQETAGPTHTVRRRESVTLLGLMERFNLLVVLGLVVVFFSFIAPSAGSFDSRLNLQTILNEKAVLAILALAAMVPLVCGQFDFSLGAIAGLSSIVTATSMSRFGLPALVAALLGVAAGAVTGMVNGWLVGRMKLNSIIATLGVATIISGLVVAYTDSRIIVTGISRTLVLTGTRTAAGIPKGVFWLAPTALVLWYVMYHTPVGRYFHAMGDNRNAATLIGLSVPRLTLLGFIGAGAIAGLAGVLMVARTGNGNPQAGPGLMLPAVAAVFLGATSFRPGRYNIPGTITAVFLVAAAVSGLALSGADPWVEQIFNGSILIAALSFAAVMSKRRGRR